MQITAPPASAAAAGFWIWAASPTRPHPALGPPSSPRCCSRGSDLSACLSLSMQFVSTRSSVPHRRFCFSRCSPCPLFAALEPPGTTSPEEQAVHVGQLHLVVVVDEQAAYPATCQHLRSNATHAAHAHHRHLHRGRSRSGSRRSIRGIRTKNTAAGCRYRARATGPVLGGGGQKSAMRYSGCRHNTCTGKTCSWCRRKSRLGRAPSRLLGLPCHDRKWSHSPRPPARPPDNGPLHPHMPLCLAPRTGAPRTDVCSYCSRPWIHPPSNSSSDPIQDPSQQPRRASVVSIHSPFQP
jgi:hypothetical protein